MGFADGHAGGPDSRATCHGVQVWSSQISSCFQVCLRPVTGKVTVTLAVIIMIAAAMQPECQHLPSGSESLDWPTAWLSGWPSIPSLPAAAGKGRQPGTGSMSARAVVVTTYYCSTEPTRLSS